jgi:hypothetical protein
MLVRKFGFINVHNLRVTVQVPEFEEFVNDFDFLACAETKLGMLDSLRGYTFYSSKPSKIS